MSDLRFSFPACVIAGKRQITPDDVGHLRRQMWPEGMRSRQQAAMAIALDACCDLKCPEWTSYLIDQVADFVVWHQPQPGTVSGDTAGWLLEGLTEDGAVLSGNGLDILLRVLDIAQGVPGFLSAVALNQLRLALLAEPQGVYASRRNGGRAVTKSDLAYVWRILRGSVERGRLQLSRGERLVLRATDALAPPTAHHPAWRELMRLAEEPGERVGLRMDWRSLLGDLKKGLDRAA